ncbi:S-layer homology domain-containing protein [Paenibacillus sp. 1011MAR3C5]|uniref:S-layer homology domain-containing protein n=1 Tax=Paenibacillus sp. 1011MAR3C5 TaxID=1675787 RepID=UPI000E6CBC1C|nr:S-layer homology domain-containing protein [Paenibacillus sp. 1011MAR3C5]RJE83611.1 S-layer homology domain-containing protein [Paenibacillus sp. 1011MAR3C5]
MTLRRKLAVTTIAASVAMSAFAGIPLSNKGLAEKLGVSNVAYAASATFPNQDIIKQLQKVEKALSGLEKQALRDLRDALNGLEDSVKGQVVAPIVNKLVDADAPDAQEKKDALKNVFIDAIALTFAPSEAKLEEFRVKHHDLIQEYATEVGVPDLTVDDIAAYFLAIQNETFKIVNKKSLVQLLDLLGDSESVNSLFEEVLAAIPNNKYAIEKVFLEYKVTTEDVVAVVSAGKAAVNDNSLFNKAAAALYEVYKRINSTSGGGSGEAGPIIDNSISAEAQTLINNLSELKAKLAAASEEEKAKLIEDAIKQVDELVKKLAVITVKVDAVDGKATVTLDETNAVIALNSIGAVIAKLQEVANVSYNAPKVAGNAGDVTENEVAVKLSANVVAAAIKAKIPAISLKIGAFGVELPFGGTFSKQVDFGYKKSDAKEDVLGGLKAASQVYDFSLSVGGVTTTSFDRPIVISLPLGDTAGLDKELLSVVKIVEGGLEIHGGRVTDTSVIESRDSFSSYVVVENKVSFGDIAGVSSWAGRAIEVVAAKGAINGKAEGVFDPNAKVTRAEFAKMLVRALDLENGSSTENFADVNANDWFAPYVAAAAEKGIIKGKSATKFDPSAPIKRAEMATMITRALQLVNGSKDVADVDAALAVFSDAAQINETLKAGVAFAADKEIVVGNNGKFDPIASATRAQAAVIIYRAINAN